MAVILSQTGTYKQLKGMYLLRNSFSLSVDLQNFVSVMGSMIKSVILSIDGGSDAVPTAPLKNPLIIEKQQTQPK